MLVLYLPSNSSKAKLSVERIVEHDVTAEDEHILVFCMRAFQAPAESHCEEIRGFAAHCVNNWKDFLLTEMSVAVVRRLWARAAAVASQRGWAGGR